MSFVRFGLILAAGLLAACSPLQEATLDNGLKIVVKEDHRAPVVVSQIWYKVGASDEPDGLTGISHVLEHMMFKGTSTHKNGEFSRIIAENGGRENAFTGADYTAYFQQLEKSRLAIAFELEADRMRNLVLDDQEVAKEIRVVMEERRLRTDDQPEALAYEHFMATAFTTNSYKNPIIGWMRDLESQRHRFACLVSALVRAEQRHAGGGRRRQIRAKSSHSRASILAMPARKLERTQVRGTGPDRNPAFASQRRRRCRSVHGYHAPAFSLRSDDWKPYALWA
jgi:hypothetical protein